MTTPVTIPNLPTATTVDLIADLIQRDVSALGTFDADQRRARHLAKEILALLVGDDDQPGPLDRYQIIAEAVPATGKPLVMWHCPDEHNGNPDGHVGIIARDMDGDQTGLTLGEIVAAVLSHEDDDHRTPA